MADSTLQDLTDLAAPSPDDVVYAVADPDGVPGDHRLSLSTLAAFVRDQVGAATVYVHDGTTYDLVGGRIFIGPEDPAADGFTLADGDQWEETP